MIAQIILTILLMGILVYAWAEYRRSPVIGLIGVFAASGGLYFVWFPRHASRLADIAGIGRGVDLIIYTWVVISLLVALNLHLKLRAQNGADHSPGARDRDCQCAHRRRKAGAAFRVDAVRVVDGNPANRCRPFSARREMLHAAETLLIAAAGAGAFRLIGFPGGLVAGSMLAVAIAALVGRPVRLPAPLARVCFVLVGILLGAVVTPATVSGIATWPLSLALLIVAAMAMLVCTGCYLYWVHGWDPLSALLGASPGSMAQALALSAELGADLRGIAIVHVMRVLLIVLGVPAGLSLFGSIVAPVAATTTAPESSFLAFAVLILASSLAAPLCCVCVFPAV